MSCHFSSSNDPFEPDCSDDTGEHAPDAPANDTEGDTNASPQTFITFIPMDSVFVSADQDLRYALISLQKDTFPPGTPPPAIVMTPKGVVQLIMNLQNILHLLEKHPTSDNSAPSLPQD